MVLAFVRDGSIGAGSPCPGPQAYRAPRIPSQPESVTGEVAITPLREVLMLTIRKFLRTLIGKATPVQILLACVLGSMLGFLPITNGAQVPALLARSLLLVLDANIFLAGLVTAATKLLSIATAPLAFASVGC